jgi:hypothetical protein
VEQSAVGKGAKRSAEQQAVDRKRKSKVKHGQKDLIREGKFGRLTLIQIDDPKDYAKRKKTSKSN